MATLKLDARFASKDRPEEDELKQRLKSQFVEKLGSKYEITQETLTHGNPDGLGELKNGTFVIRTSAKIPEMDFETIKEKLGEKS